MGRHPRKEIICKCNEVERSTIESAIRGGCKTLNDIFDQTTAGVGPCGGSCRRKLAPLLRQYLENGSFPEKIVEDAKMPFIEEEKKRPANEPAAAPSFEELAKRSDGIAESRGRPGDKSRKRYSPS